MKSITIRGIDSKLHQALEKASKKENSSLNKTILSLLRKATGIEAESTYPCYHDLDHLAGTWSEQDEQEFLANTAQFRTIDEELWQ